WSIYALVWGRLQLQIPNVLARIERGITVTFRHQVHFTEGVFEPSNTLLRDILASDPSEGRARVLVVLDDGIVRGQPGLPGRVEAWFDAHGCAVELGSAPLSVEGGERVKNAYFHVSDIHERIDRHHLDRHNYVIGVGGGALLDIVWFAAATAHRGVRHVRLPTTTLAQADSGVGVKNGINAFGKKNFIGTFAPPAAVINDFDLLASLPVRDKRAGYSEAVKVALIRDGKFFETLERDAAALRDFEPEAMQRLIYRCAELHINHIATSGDPFELGSARPLDFGHWAAHKLEQLSDYQLRPG